MSTPLTVAGSQPGREVRADHRRPSAALATIQPAWVSRAAGKRARYWTSWN
jgi:hypothetical protein